MTSLVRLLRAVRIALFGMPHRHRWQIIRAVNLIEEVGSHPHGQRYTLQCEGCGKITVKVVD